MIYQRYNNPNQTILISGMYGREKRKRDTNWQEIADDWQGIEARDSNEQEITDDSQGEESSNNQEDQENQEDMNGDIPF